MAFVFYLFTCEKQCVQSDERTQEQQQRASLLQQQAWPRPSWPPRPQCTEHDGLHDQQENHPLGQRHPSQHHHCARNQKAHNRNPCRGAQRIQQNSWKKHGRYGAFWLSMLVEQWKNVWSILPAADVKKALLMLYES